MGYLDGIMRFLIEAFPSLATSCYYQGGEAGEGWGGEVAFLHANSTMGRIVFLGERGGNILGWSFHH